MTVEARARENSGALTGRVRVAMPPEYGSHWLGPRLPDFRAAYPQIELQILVVGTRERDLSRGEADLAIQPPRPTQTGMIALRIGRASARLYVVRDLVSDKRLRIRKPADLRGLPLLVYTPPFQMLQDAKWFQPILASATIALETNSTHALLAAARAGTGITVLPRFVARAHPDLIAVSADVCSHDLLVIMHPEVRRDPRIRAAADFLKRIATEPPGLS